MIFTHLFVALYFVCIVFSIIDDCPFVASGKYAHCRVFCCLRTDVLYNRSCKSDSIHNKLQALVIFQVALSFWTVCFQKTILYKKLH